MKEHQRKVIEDYIRSYNAFDVEGMTRDLHDEIVFENIANGEVDLSTHGLAEFKVQAEKAKDYFTEREQSIYNWTFDGDIVTIDISYEGVLAIDLPGGASKGDTLALKGQSEFLFKDGKIITIKDMS